jgi:hypothetical protein
MRNRPGPIVRRLLRAPGLLYDWHAGWLLGHRFLRPHPPGPPVGPAPSDHAGGGRDRPGARRGRRRGRTGPVGGLVPQPPGRPWDGSDDARRRLAGQLPLVALRPDHP